MVAIPHGAVVGVNVGIIDDVLLATCEGAALATPHGLLVGALHRTLDVLFDGTVQQ